MTSSLMMKDLKSAGISEKETTGTGPAGKSTKDAKTEEKTANYLESSCPHNDNTDSYSNALLNESFDSLSEVRQSFSPTTDESDTFSLSDPLPSPTLPKRNDFCLAKPLRVDITIPKLKMTDEDAYSCGDVSPIKIKHKPDHCSTSSPPFEATKLSDEIDHGQLRYRRHPPSVSAVSYVAPDTPVRWAQSAAYYASPMTSNPYFVIRSASKQLAALKYILPCLNRENVCPVNVSEYHGHIRHYQENNANSHDVIIGRRRVEAAICAFGGVVPTNQRQQQKLSIFREKNDPLCKARRHYERILPSRYSISGRQISWDVEENPPILDNDGANAEDDTYTNDYEGKKSPTRHASKRIRQEAPTTPLSLASVGDGSSPSSSKYRCKLCGQPKHNHSCPYRPSVQRSIGVMVYPAVNAYAAAEPGRIAPALTEMNNNALYDSDYHEATSPDMMVTPEAARLTGPIFHSPESTLSCDDSHSKRSYDVMNAKTSPFVASLTLHPEQFRAVTPSDKSGNTHAFVYPPISLTFTERKRLSDTLFVLARQIPNMTEETSVVLHQARADQKWDQGTAELLTQVVIGLFCVEGDARLDGLQRYLLSLGISC